MKKSLWAPVDDLRGLTGINTDYFLDFSLQRWSRLELRRPGSATARLLLLEGIAASAAKRHGDASRAFDAAARERPDVAGFFLLAGRERWALKDREGAVTRFSAAVAANPDAVEGFALLLGVSPFAGTHEGSPDETVRRRASAVIGRERPWWAYALRGSCRFARVRDAAEAGRARADLERAARLNPRAPWLKAFLAQLVWHAEPERALSAIESACRGMPKSGWALAWRGQLRLQLRRAGGERDLSRAIALSPYYALARTWLAGARLTRGDIAGAEEQLDAALRLSPDHALSLYLLAQARRRQGRTREALVLLTRAALREPESERFFHPGATAAQARADALKLRAMRRKHPDDAALRLWLGQVLLAAGRPVEAAAELAEFSRGVRGNRELDALKGWANVWSARCFESLGKRKQGAALRARALKLNPGIGYFRGC